MTAIQPSGKPRYAPSRFSQAALLAVFLASIAALVVVANYFARREPYRVQIDATKTRAYSLSSQSRQLLAALNGDWTIALVMDQKKTDRAMRRQIDEVLKRYTDASPHIAVLRIDPADPQTLGAYEALLGRLNQVYREPIAEYDRALDDGAARFAALLEFARQQSAVLQQVVAQVPASDPTKATLEQRYNRLALLAQQGNLVQGEVAKARRIDESRAIPDYDAARSILAQALATYATELDEVAGVFGKWLERPNPDASVTKFATAAQREYQQMAQGLAEGADVLKRLPSMELSPIGAQLQQGEAAVIIGPAGAAVIPSSQLFPKTNIKRGENNGVSFDQRFRGEQLITATIRSLTVGQMPLVVFVHGQDESMLRPRDKQADLVGVGSILKSSRFEVAEWIPAKQKDRPAGAKGQPVVWVIVPPPQRSGLELTKPEKALLEAVSTLIADGEPVMLSLYPSLVSKYGQADPWATLARPMGITAETEHVILENVRISDSAKQTQRGEAIQDFNGEHLIARAINGQQAYFTLPVPVRAEAGAAASVRAGVLVEIAPSDDRWLEKDWNSDASSVEDPKDELKLKAAVPIAIAAERESPHGKGTQRMIVIGSAGWMLRFVSDGVVDVGGGRAALVNPGNNELMLAGVAWLAGMDDLIAASPLSQETVRLQDVTPEVRSLWFWLLVVVLPAACMSLGVLVWIWRRT